MPAILINNSPLLQNLPSPGPSGGDLLSGLSIRNQLIHPVSGPAPSDLQRTGSVSDLSVSDDSLLRPYVGFRVTETLTPPLDDELLHSLRTAPSLLPRFLNTLDWPNPDNSVPAPDDGSLLQGHGDLPDAGPHLPTPIFGQQELTIPDGWQPAPVTEFVQEPIDLADAAPEPIELALVVADRPEFTLIATSNNIMSLGVIDDNVATVELIGYNAPPATTDGLFG